MACPDERRRYRSSARQVQLAMLSCLWPVSKMSASANRSRIPLRFVLSGLGAAVLLVATVLSALYLGGQTQARFQNIDAS